MSQRSSPSTIDLSSLEESMWSRNHVHCQKNLNTIQMCYRWVNTQEKSSTTWLVNTQEQREGLTLSFGRNWSFPASVKIEDSEYLLLPSTKDKIYRSDWCALTICFLPSVGLLRVLALRCFSWFLGFHCVEQNPRIPRLEFRDFVPATACFSFFLCFLHVRCTAHCRQQCVHANLANIPSHISCNSFFSWVMTPTLTPVRPGL